MHIAVPFELKWQGRRWRQADIERLEPYVNDALTLAHTGLQQLGLQINNKKRVGLVKRTPKWIMENGMGESPTAHNMRLYLDPTTIREAHLPRRIGNVAVATVHEAIHCIRSERRPHNTFPEGIASEGLAYFGHSQFMTSHQGTDYEATGVINFATQLEPAYPPDDIQDMTATFLEDLDVVTTIYDTDEAQSIWDKWMEGPTDGCVIGYIAVNKLVRSGSTFADVMQMPAMGILEVLR